MISVFDIEGWLGRQHTRALLALRDKIYRTQNGRYYLGDDATTGPYVTMRQVKRVLALREHIPNRPEGRAARRRRQKQNHGRNKDKSR